MFSEQQWVPLVAQIKRAHDSLHAYDMKHIWSLQVSQNSYL